MHHGALLIDMVCSHGGFLTSMICSRGGLFFIVVFTCGNLHTVIAQVVGWENPYLTTKWRQLVGNLPTLTLGRCPRHFGGEVVTSREEFR
jgi:hypothetical protein